MKTVRRLRGAARATLTGPSKPPPKIGDYGAHNLGVTPCAKAFHHANEPRRFGRDSGGTLSYAKIFTIPTRRKIIRYEK